MYYLYAPGSDVKRTLNAADVAGACTIYPARGARGVSPDVDAGHVVEGPCDPTPRNGFAAACVPDAGNQPPSQAPTALTCGASGRPASPPPPVALLALAALAAAYCARRRLPA